MGLKREEVTGDWRGLHNEELYAMHFSPESIRLIKSRRLRWARHVALTGEMKGPCSLLVGKPEGRIILGRAGGTWEDNIKIDIQEVGRGRGLDLHQDRDRWRAVVNAVMNRRVS